jgi:hypothetical protein
MIDEPNPYTGCSTDLRELYGLSSQAGHIIFPQKCPSDFPPRVDHQFQPFGKSDAMRCDAMLDR